MHVVDYLRERNVAFETLVHPPAFTAQRRARLLHVSGRQVAKAVLLVTPTRRLVAVLPACARLDLAAIAGHLGESVRLADDDELAETFAECERGAASAFGRRVGVATLIDAALDGLILFEADRHFLSIRMRCADFEQVENPTRIPLTSRN